MLEIKLSYLILSYLILSYSQVSTFHALTFTHLVNIPTRPTVQRVFQISTCIYLILFTGNLYPRAYNANVRLHLL